MEYAVILAGGSGTRLWPLSRQGMPKQLLTLFDGQSLLQLAFQRALSFVDPKRVLVCAAQAYREVITDQLPDLLEENLLLEPVGRDSLPAACWSTGVIAQRDPDAVVALLTADHIITPISGFQAALVKAMAIASENRDVLVTMGVEPSLPHTGFGYLHIQPTTMRADQVFSVKRFTEKPSLDLARQYLRAGDWWWNSGMFCWRADAFLSQVRRFQPDMASAIFHLLRQPDLIDSIYPSLNRISIDYAIMEPLCREASTVEVVAIPLQANWADIGNFPALAKQLPHALGNAVEGLVVVHNSDGNLILNRSSDRLIAVSGLTDMIVVQDNDVTLICPKDQAESIKTLVELVRSGPEQYV